MPFWTMFLLHFLVLGVWTWQINQWIKWTQLQLIPFSLTMFVISCKSVKVNKGPTISAVKSSQLDLQEKSTTSATHKNVVSMWPKLVTKFSYWRIAFFQITYLYKINFWFISQTGLTEKHAKRIIWWIQWNQTEVTCLSIH